MTDSPAIQARLAAIVDSSDDAIVSKDLNGIVTSWNRAAERMFGWAASEIIGQSIRKIIPADRQSEEDEVLARVRRGDPVEHFETIRQRKDGSLIPISLTVSPMRDASGTIIGASKIARDISERRRAESLAELTARRANFLAQISGALTESLDIDDMLRQLVRSAVPAIADWCAVDVLSEDGTPNRVAAEHVDPSKIGLAEEVRSRYGDPEAAFSPVRVIKTGKPALLTPITDELLVKRSAGDQERLQLTRELGFVSYLCVPMSAHGTTLGAVTLATAESGRVYTDNDLQFAQDLASRAALAMDNARSYQRLEVANRLKDEFLATLSHELRTPLNAVLGYSRMLRSGVVAPEKTTQALETIERNATSLTQIVEDVLDVSRIVSGKVRLQVQSLELERVLRDAAATIQPAADAKGIKIHTLIDSKVGPISGDPDRLQQVLWNLLSNAVKFTPKGGQVQLRLEPVNSHVEIVVADSGIGIRSEFLPYIFERFRQAEGGTTRRHGGLGLGLAIARHIVEMHGGSIHVASGGEGQGTTFRIKLPIMIVQPEKHPELERVHPRTGRGGVPIKLPDLTGVRVLAVDDDRDALLMLSEILQSRGARVTTVNSVPMALETMTSHLPDVLIADLGMPLMDGFDLIKSIRESPEPHINGIPAAALTAYARSEDRAKALHAGFSLHLSKPVDPVELIAAVSSLARARVR